MGRRNRSIAKRRVYVIDICVVSSILGFGIEWKPRQWLWLMWGTYREPAAVTCKIMGNGPHVHNSAHTHKLAR